MSEQDDDGSAVTLPLLLLPPPPPQPAARSASVTVTPTSGANETHFLTCPPRSLDGSMPRPTPVRRRGGWPSIGPRVRILQVASAGGQAGARAWPRPLARAWKSDSSRAGRGVSSVDARPQIVDGPAARRNRVPSW